MGQRISRSDLGIQRASCLEPKRRTCAGQYSSSHRCAPAGHLRADGNYSQVRLRTAACANGARSTAVARCDGRSHKRPGGTSTKLVASVPFDPSVGAIGVDLAASLGQHAPRRSGPTTFLVGDSNDRCARTERHGLAVWQGDEGRTATARIGCHHQYHAVAACECSWRRERMSCRWQLRFGARSRDGTRCTPWVVGGLSVPVAPPRRPSATPGRKIRSV